MVKSTSSTLFDQFHFCCYSCWHLKISSHRCHSVKLLSYVFISVNLLFQMVNGNDFIGMKWLLGDKKCKSLLDQPDSKSGLSLLMTAALAGKCLKSTMFVWKHRQGLHLPFSAIMECMMQGRYSLPNSCPEASVL